MHIPIPQNSTVPAPFIKLVGFDKVTALGMNATSTVTVTVDASHMTVSLELYVCNGERKRKRGRKSGRERRRAGEREGEREKSVGGREGGKD